MISHSTDGNMPAWLKNTGPETDVVVSTRIRLARNLPRRRFPLTASLQERKGVFDALTGVIRDVGRGRGFSVYNFCGLPRLDQQYLVEERVASPELMRIDGDRGVVCDSDHRISVMINEEDHVRIQGLDSGVREKDVWPILSELDDRVGAEVGYAFDSRRGHLTTCPTNSGTGLRVSFLMHLPALVLTKTIDQVLQGASQMGMCTRGFFGENSEVVGGLFQMSNQATLGSSEEDFLAAVHDAVDSAVGYERRARERILKDARGELEDKIFRSYGILCHARSLEVNEFLTLSSALRLGIETGLFTETTIDELNRLMLMVMPAHLQRSMDCSMGPEEMSRARANVVGGFLKGTK